MRLSSLSHVGQAIDTLRGHDDEVLDVSFDYTGQYVLTASADSTARVYNASTNQLLSTLEGHEGEISKVRATSLSNVTEIICHCSSL